jgi:prepilin-type processing-associated H-X9-DG protein
VGDVIDNSDNVYLPTGQPVNLSDVHDPSSTIAIGETRFRSYWDCGPLFLQGIFPDIKGDKDADGAPLPGVVHHHDKRINYLFLDGSVKSLMAIQTFLPRSLWGSPNLTKDLEGSVFEVPVDPMKSDDPLIQKIASEYR